MWFLAAYHPEFFAILADTLEVTLCYSSSENRLVNQSRPILSENEIGYAMPPLKGWHLCDRWVRLLSIQGTYKFVSKTLDVYGVDPLCGTPPLPSIRRRGEK